ncbi:F-box protein At3g56470-like [Papaver somniferum]|uniref:F-box protein At3g56470-like n=1 Tax=Papaver somniferum TaxID=3469 RepID=UPI000E6FBA31|nr:F-box protein At3g56470-like [Papaver somniferum]
MPVNVQGRVESMLGKDEENSFLTELEIKTCSRMVVHDENQGENCNVGEVEAASYWDNLDEDIVLVISNHLHGSDSKNFRLVCKANRAIMPKVQATSYLSPWLVFSRDLKYTIYNVVNPMYNDENYAINLYDLTGCTICFQKGGWLLMTRKENLFFYNPFTRETVNIPNMDVGNYSVVSFSSLPTSSDCIVFAMARRNDGIYINCIRKGEAHWIHWSFFNFHNTNIERSMPFLSTAVFHDGDFFCLDDHGTVGRFSTKDNNWKVVKEPDEEFYQGHLVECFGALLLVQLEHCGTPVKISKLNFSEMEWVEV